MEGLNRPKFSEGVQKILSERKNNVSLEEAAYFGYQRLLYFLCKAKPSNPDLLHALDHTCLDLSHAGAYLGNVLYHRSKEGAGEAYKQAYDLGLELVERLVFIGSKDESLDLADVIHSLVECYKAM